MTVAYAAVERKIMQPYRDVSDDIPGLSLNPPPPRPVLMDGYWMSTVAYDPAVAVTREILKESFARGAIDARVFFYAR